MPLPYGENFLLLLLCSLAVFQHLDEEAEEHEGGDRSGDEIGNRLSQEHGEGLILEEVGQNEDQGDQQDDLTQQRHDQTDLGLTQGHEGLLAGNLEANGEAAGQEDLQRPSGVVHQGHVAGKDACKEV